jgi:hypothetical protein
VPSLLGAIGAVVLTYWAALAFVSRRAALLAGLMMASCVLLGIERLIAKTDAMLLLTVVAAMGAMARAYLRDRRERLGPASRRCLAGIFWSASPSAWRPHGADHRHDCRTGCHALIVVDRSALLLNTQAAGRNRLARAAVSCHWFVAIVGRAGDAFYASRLDKTCSAKFLPARESHGAPHGTYFVLFWLTFWPGANLGGIGDAGDLGRRP